MSDQVSDPLVAFAVKWEPYGGASADDVLVEFGLDMSEYRLRLFQKISRADRAGVSAPLRSRLVSYALVAVHRAPRIGK
ncbi:hypothetical protein RhoFasGS6_04398 [Rhodococcus fascians]|uniref:hypothetical protein n=1 Tax=Rhodococcoides fascians TaxID=1828 RepID=UPI001427ED16|nr:hypothetical protein [Rhodococcus fascians]